MSVLFNELENPKTRNADSKIYRWSIYDNPYFLNRLLTLWFKATLELG